MSGAKFLFTTLLFLTSANAFAGAAFDLNSLYFKDTTTTTAAQSQADTIYAFFAGFSLSSKSRFYLGWNYASYSTTATPTTGLATTYASKQMGPAVMYFLDKDHNWHTSFAYNISTKADYKAGAAAAQKWTGTGMAADIGYQYYFGESFALGVRLNYSKSTYTQKLVGTTATDVSYSKVLIYPSIALTIEL
jgi:hypothetical protein